MAIRGICMSCIMKRYNLFSIFHVAGATNQSFIKHNRREGWLEAHRIFWVTTAMTSSWAAAEIRKVTNMARERENWYELMVDA
jgi:hypothetical protein